MVDFSWRGAAAGLLGGIKEERDKAKEFQRSEKIRNAEMMRQQELYKWKKQQDLLSEEDAFTAKEKRAANAFGKGTAKYNQYLYGVKETAPKGKMTQHEYRGHLDKINDQMMKMISEGTLTNKQAEAWAQEERKQLRELYEGKVKPTTMPFTSELGNRKAQRLTELSGKDRKAAEAEIKKKHTPEEAKFILDRAKELEGEEGLLAVKPRKKKEKVSKFTDKDIPPQPPKTPEEYRAALAAPTSGRGLLEGLSLGDILKDIRMKQEKITKELPEDVRKAYRR